MRLRGGKGLGVCEVNLEGGGIVISGKLDASVGDVGRRWVVISNDGLEMGVGERVRSEGGGCESCEGGRGGLGVWRASSSWKWRRGGGGSYEKIRKGTEDESRGSGRKREGCDLHRSIGQVEMSSRA